MIGPIMRVEVRNNALKGVVANYAKLGYEIMHGKA